MLRLGGKQPDKDKSKLQKRTNLTSYYRGSGEKSTASPFKQRPPKVGKARKFLFGTADVMLLILLACGLVYSLMLKSKPAVKITSNAYHPSAYYQQQITPMFGGIKNSNKISFSEAPIVQMIQTKFPEVRSAHIELPFFSEQPVVWLDISEPAFVLKGSDKQVLLVDSQGVAVEPVKKLSEYSSLPTIKDESGFKSKPGQQVISSDAVNFIATLLAQAKAAKVPLKSLVVPAKAQELDLYTSDTGYYTKFYLGGDPLVQSGQFLAARHKFSQSGQQPSQYLDVRVAGKIFYK